MIRLFVGLPMPEVIAQGLAGLANGMLGAHWPGAHWPGAHWPGAHWIEPENMHVTLRFIGEVNEADAEELHLELTRLIAKPFSYTITGFDTFGQGRKAHALFAGVPLTPELEILQTRTEAAVVRAGQPRETRKFKPHVTIARLKSPPADQLQAFIESNNLWRAGPIAVDHFILYESRMGNGGSAYFPLAEYRLAPERR